MIIQCKTCGEEVTYGGRGRRPVYCKPHAKAANVARTRAGQKRKAAHARGETLGKWGDLWLVDGKPVKRRVSDQSRDRKDSFKYSMYDDPRRDSGEGAEILVVSNETGVFAPLHTQGAEVGTSTTNKELSATTSQRERDAAQDPWQKENRLWWKFEEFANTAISIDVRDAIGVHGSGAEVKPHTQEELDDWADWIDGLEVSEYTRLQHEMANRKRVQNGLAPIKEKNMARNWNDFTSSLDYINGRSPVGPMANVYGSAPWTTFQMSQLVRLVKEGKKYSEIARDYSDLIGGRTQDALSRKYKRLVKQDLIGGLFYGSLDLKGILREES